MFNSVQLNDCLLLTAVVLGGRASGESQHQPGLLPLRPAVSYGPRICLSAGEKLLQHGTITLKTNHLTRVWNT